MFTDAAYDSINFKVLDNYLRQNYAYVWPAKLPEIVAMGQSYIVGETPTHAIKLDLYYTDTFTWDVVQSDNIRLASMKEIAAMKMDVIQRIGRKKDFWDLHEMLDNYTIDEMIEFHESRYPYGHDEQLIRANLVNFSNADNDFDPECVKGKQWEIVKLDIVELVEGNSLT